MGGEGNGNPLQYSCLENAMDSGAWWATVQRVTKSRTQIEVTEHELGCSILSPGGVIKSSASLYITAKSNPGDRAWQPIPVFLPGEFHGQMSLVGSHVSTGSQRVRHD